jgi:prepilin-type N-terminal cleavage/methylation domain-containing protein
MFHPRIHRRAQGFTLVEILVALTILALVITTSLAIFFDRQKRLKFASDMIAASQVLANEAEIWRHADYSELTPGTAYDEFVSDTALIDGLPNVETTIDVEPYAGGVREVILRVTWGEKGTQRKAELSVYRANLANGALF